MAILILFTALALAVENGASDIHINRQACCLRMGRLDPVTSDDVREFIEQTVPEQFMRNAHLYR